MRDQRHDFHDDSDRPFSVSHLVNTLRRYSSVIFVSMLGVLGAMERERITWDQTRLNAGVGDAATAPPEVVGA